MQYLSNLNTAVSPCKDKTSQDKTTGVHAYIHTYLHMYILYHTYKAKGDDTTVSLSAGSTYLLAPSRIRVPFTIKLHLLTLVTA